MREVNYTWADFKRWSKQLHTQILDSQYKPKHIIAISRGGNVLGTVLSYKLNIPLTVYDPKIQNLDDFKYIDYQKDLILFVDDINDSGKTIKKFKMEVIRTLKNDYQEGWENIFTLNNIKFCTIFTTNVSISTVDYSAADVDKLIPENKDIWLNFPWEYL